MLRELCVAVALCAGCVPRSDPSRAGGCVEPSEARRRIRSAWRRMNRRDEIAFTRCHVGLGMGCPGLPPSGVDEPNTLG
jgi:hypothetical protein